MLWCDHWLMQYEKTCMGVRMWAEYGWQGAAGIVIASAVLLLIAHLVGRAA